MCTLITLEMTKIYFNLFYDKCMNNVNAMPILDAVRQRFGNTFLISS